MQMINKHIRNANRNNISSNQDTMTATEKTNRYWQQSWNKGTHVYCWRDCKLVQSLLKSGWRFLSKTKLEQLFDLTTPFLGTYPKSVNLVLEILAPHVSGALSTIAKLYNPFKYLSMDE